jgi:HK97 family phage major capsid protein
MAEESNFSELDKLRSVDELVTLKESLKREIVDLDTEFGVTPMPPDIGAQFASKKELHAEIVRRLEERANRAKIVASVAGDDNHVERAAPAMIVRKTEADIYDIAAIESGSKSVEDRSQRYRDNAMRSVETTVVPYGDELGAKHHMARLLDYSDSPDKEIARRVLLTGNPAYKRAFNKYLKDGNANGFSPEEQRAAALAVTGTTTTGGYAVPYLFDPTFIAIGAHTSVNPYRAACRVETIAGGNNWRAVTATAITAKWDAEAAASVEGGPTIGQPTFTVQRADAFVTASIEALQDRPDLSGELGKLFQEGKDTLEENSFTLGVGTTVYPQGMFLSGAFTVQSTATNDVTAIADLQLLEAALPLRHRMAPGAAMFMSRSTQRQLEALDTTGYYFKRPGQFFAMGKAEPQNSPTGNTGTQCLGYPIWEVPSAVSTLTTDAAVIVVFGDPKNYVIVDRIGMNVEVIQNMLNGATPSFPTGQRGIYAYWRATARALNVDGMRQLDVN